MLFFKLRRISRFDPTYSTYILVHLCITEQKVVFFKVYVIKSLTLNHKEAEFGCACNNYLICFLFKCSKTSTDLPLPYIDRLISVPNDHPYTMHHCSDIIIPETDHLSKWTIYSRPHGWSVQRGFTVYIYTVKPLYPK